MIWIIAMRIKFSATVVRILKSLAMRLEFLIQAKIRSTIQRLTMTAHPPLILVEIWMTRFNIFSTNLTDVLPYTASAEKWRKSGCFWLTRSNTGQCIVDVGCVNPHMEQVSTTIYRRNVTFTSLNFFPPSKPPASR
jgi:hypothetical protein